MKNNLMLSLNNAKDYLKNRNENGHSVYSHICDLINFIIVEKPEKCYENFEMISNHIKESKKKDPISSSFSTTNNDSGNNSKELNLKDSNLDNYILKDYIKKKKVWLAKIKLLFQPDANDKPAHLPFMKNFYEQAKLINWAGYHIKNHSVCFINESIKNVLQKYKHELMSLNFWGILKGVKNDYYILEGLLKADSNLLFQRKKKKFKILSDSNQSISSSSDTFSSMVRGQADDKSGGDEEDEDDKEDEDDEEDEDDDTDDAIKKRTKKRTRGQTSKKEGECEFKYKEEDYANFNKKVNKYIYWVSVNGTEDWVQLKHTTPEYIKIASRANKLLTGNMNKTITSFPNIAIKEKHYLRALISLISSYTHISPKKYYISTEGGKKKQGIVKRKKEIDSDNNEEGEVEHSDGSKEKFDDSGESKEENENIENDQWEDDDDDENKRNNEVKQDYHDDDLIENKKFQFDTNILLQLENWVYFKYNFLPNGHISYPKIGSNKNAKIKTFIKQNPPLKILRSINRQKENQNIHTWKMRHYNHGNYYGDHNLHYDIIVIYNLFFYGAFTVYSNKQFFNFYIGNGIKSKHAFIHTYQPGKIESDESELSEIDDTG
ncbi:hypothetical protein, conserved [Plasmodium gonderi]|uniref:Radial spoke head protein n=1 Tax=Plasmodium gonderi TaxID=77519 RepID=A0A1Y1JLA7_PLAGO|nr:hypothetical protein, conserved [Plasmodium gonderi]GAW80824.1 hypothetical protein, conserved [Plasmodium gonderi]